MAYNEDLASRIKASLAGMKNVQEKKMFGGIAFMVDDTMCIGVNNDDIILRCEKEETDTLLKKKGAKVFDLSGGRPMKGWLLVGPEGTSHKKDFEWWFNQAMEGCKKAQASGKKKT